MVRKDVLLRRTKSVMKNSKQLVEHCKKENKMLIISSENNRSDKFFKMVPKLTEPFFYLFIRKLVGNIDSIIKSKIAFIFIDIRKRKRRNSCLSQGGV